MEIYKEWAPETCLGCGEAIRTGDIVMPVDRGWLLCLDCAQDYTFGTPLKAWRQGREDPERRQAGEAG